MSKGKFEKILVIFDISKTLLLAEIVGKQKFFDKRSILEKYQQDDKFGKYSIFWRTGRAEFLDEFFVKNYEKFDVAVWSSNDRLTTEAFTKSFFGRHQRNLLFVSATNRALYEGKQAEYGVHPIPIHRELTQVTQKFTDYDLNNMVVVSPYKNNSELYQCKLYKDLFLFKLTMYQYLHIALKVLGIILKMTSLCKHSLSIQKEQVCYIMRESKILMIQIQVRVSDIRTAIRSKSFTKMNLRALHANDQYQEYL